MKLLETKIHIKASPEKVWSILIDLDQYTNWNPFITKAVGKVQVNEKLKVSISLPNGKKMIFEPTVKSVIENHEFSWLGQFILPGIFDGKHIFIIEENENGCLFIQREYFSGLLVPLVWNSMKTNTREGFELMNHSLKQRAENT